MHLSNHPFIHPFMYSFIDPNRPINLPNHSPIHASVRSYTRFLCIHPSTYPRSHSSTQTDSLTHPPIHPSFHPSIRPSVRPSVHPSTHPPSHSSIHPLTHTSIPCSQYGDYDQATFQPGMLATENLLPQRVIDQYQLTREMWEDRIKFWYADHKGMTRWVLWFSSPEFFVNFPFQSRILCKLSIIVKNETKNAESVNSWDEPLFSEAHKVISFARSELFHNDHPKFRKITKLHFITETYIVLACLRLRLGCSEFSKRIFPCGWSQKSRMFRGRILFRWHCLASLFTMYICKLLDCGIPVQS